MNSPFVAAAAAPKLKMPSKADFTRLGETDALAQKAGCLKRTHFGREATSWQAKTYFAAFDKALAGTSDTATAPSEQ